MGDGDREQVESFGGPLDSEVGLGDAPDDALRFLRRRAWAGGYVAGATLPVPTRVDYGEREAWLAGFDEAWLDAGRRAR